MTSSQLVEMPLAEQAALAETILNGLDTTVESSVRDACGKWKSRHGKHLIITTTTRMSPYGVKWTAAFIGELSR